MTEATWYSQGAFCWTECATTDVQGARDFYTKLFGWEVDEQDIPGGGTYSMFTQDGKNVAAATPLRDENQGIPPHWNVYIAVEDADQVAKQAEQLGGTVVAPAFDVAESGRMAVVQDPTGGTIGLWQAREHIGAQVYAEPNTLTWYELTTPDPQRAVEFYRELFDYGTESQETPTGTYWILTHKGEQAGGVFKSPQEGLPAAWTPYFHVEDIDAAIKTATGLGATILVPQTETPQAGTWAWLTDPQGVVFAVIQPVPQR